MHIGNEFIFRGINDIIFRFIVKGFYIFMKNDSLYYSVGALLYCPANRESIADSVIHEKFGKRFSLALCLEDTINDSFVAEAEEVLVKSLEKIYRKHQDKDFYLPKIFIRVRAAEQIAKLVKRLGVSSELVTGFIIPKFSMENADEFINEIIRVNESGQNSFYMMPIYESASIIDLRKRYDILYSLKESLSKIEELVLNIRVGGNDLCHCFGFRRHADESIHKISPIANIFSDIITVYGSDYVVSGPVWEYYNGPHWRDGMFCEIHDDKLCGFSGKTVIHPKQIAVVNEAFRVSQADFEDAKAVLGWSQDSFLYVSGGHKGQRMNEYKTHLNWAQRTLYLAQVFGVETVSLTEVV